MASSTFFFAVTLLVAFSSAAPNGKKVPQFKVPEECKGKGFCAIKPEGYDDIEDMINSLLPKHLTGLNMADRIGEGTGSELSPESDWHNCPYRKSTESKYIFSGANHTKMDILVQTKLLYQPIEIVTCAYDVLDDESGSEQCFQQLGLKSFSMKATCQSSTAKRTLFVYDPEAHEIKRKEYDVPCCCTCQITKET